MTKVQNISKSFREVANIAFDNLPEWIAIVYITYIRDPNNRSKEQPDGETKIDFMCKWCHLYDIASVREQVTHELNDLRF